MKYENPEIIVAKIFLASYALHSEMVELEFKHHNKRIESRFNKKFDKFFKIADFNIHKDYDKGQIFMQSVQKEGGIISLLAFIHTQVDLLANHDVRLADYLKKMFLILDKLKLPKTEPQPVKLTLINQYFGIKWNKK